MFTCIGIILIIIAIIAYNTSDNRDYQAEQKLVSIPPLHFVSQRNDSMGRLFSGELLKWDSNILEDFNFHNGWIVLTMRNGTQISGYLNQMVIRFDKEKYDGISINVKCLNGSVKFYKTSNFTEGQWNAMLSILFLAGKTYGASLFGKLYKDSFKYNQAQQLAYSFYH